MATGFGGGFPVADYLRDAANVQHEPAIVEYELRLRKSLAA